MDALLRLTGVYWDWEMHRWDAAGLRLIAGNDLTYHHLVEVTFTDVAWAAVSDLFHHPVFRLPTKAEHDSASGGATVFTWDAETATGTVPMMVVAERVSVVEGLVRH